MSDCYYDSAGCLICPEQMAVAGIPARVERQAIAGWNAGANSIMTLDNDLHTVFPMPVGLGGVIMGLKGERSRQTTPTLIEHGMYFLSSAAVNFVQAIESGVVRGARVQRLSSDTFEIRRINGVVTYWKSGVLLYTSTVPSSGAKVVNACLYVSADAVGAAA